MPILKIFDQLLQFPLFQGMSRDDLEIIAGHIRFGFVKIPAGRPVAEVGDACQQLYFLINGSLKVETSSEDYGYTVKNTSLPLMSYSRRPSLAIISAIHTTIPPSLMPIF